MDHSKDTFHISGPVHLISNFDWTNRCHQRSVLASLVEGAYILERDRQQNRKGRKAFGPPWCDSFGFQLNQPLVDDDDKSYYGAIYEYTEWSSNRPGHPPRYVIAFRGTIRKLASLPQDLKLNLQFTCNRLHRCSRFQHGLQIAQDIVVQAGAENVWLAGHSLGSAIALLVGRNMVKMGFYIETYLFNPPFVSLPLIELFNINEKLKFGIRTANSISTAILAAAVGHKQKAKHEDPFIVLSDWIPHLFVNPSDPICNEYIGYFEDRDTMVAIGAREIGMLATQISKRSLLIAGKDSEPIHLLPSAYLTINLSSSQDLKQAHGIDQWWKPDIYCNYKLHQFKPDFCHS